MAWTKEHDQSQIISTTRLESFSDGVMAVIITLMAFNLRPPAHQSWSSLSHRLPDLAIYVLSFAVIAVYWNNHHHLLRVTTTISTGVMWTNLVLLFWLSLVPVMTQWVGQAPSSRWPAVGYTLVSFLAASTYFILSRAIVRANHHDTALTTALGYDLKGFLSWAWGLVAVGLALWRPYLGYAGDIILSVLWAVPDKRLVRPNSQ